MRKVASLSAQPLSRSLTSTRFAPLRSGYESLGRRARKDGHDVPYKQITQLPDSVKNNLPKHAQEIYKEAFNSAEDQYGEEDRAHRVAWSAVENTYEKNDKGNWVKKSS
jgi:cation transport regulator